MLLKPAEDVCRGGEPKLGEAFCGKSIFRPYSKTVGQVGTVVDVVAFGLPIRRSEASV